MATLREIRTKWTTSSGLALYTIMYFEGGIAVATQRTALQTFWQAVDNSLSTTTSWAIENAGREINDTTGALTGAWSSGSILTGSGASVGAPVADATQGLIQWRTASIVGGRFLRGRTFVPGLVGSLLTAGNLDPAVISNWQTAGNAFIASAAGLVVWHRPIAGSGGSHDAVSTCTVWNELAVLRRRRN